MALQKGALNLNRGLKELQPHGTLDFSCAGYASYHTESQADIIPWHWHEEIEIVFIEEGELELKTPLNTFCLKKGDCVVVNSNILHYGATSSFCKLHSLVFHWLLIAGSNNSAFAKKYMLPLMSCPSFSGYFIGRSDNQAMTIWFNKAYQALMQNEAGFEFTVRENLSNICFFLYEQFQEEFTIPNIIQDQDNFRMRKMLEFIQENFYETVSLAEIARAADIGERECLRCFQKTIQLSPIQYLLKYRIMRGQEMLLNNPANSISEIATFCGFDSPSNFAKMFKRFYKQTPREYRKSNIEVQCKVGYNRNIKTSFGRYL